MRATRQSVRPSRRQHCCFGKRRHCGFPSQGPPQGRQSQQQEGCVRSTRWQQGLEPTSEAVCKRGGQGRVKSSRPPSIGAGQHGRKPWGVYKWAGTQAVTSRKPNQHHKTAQQKQTDSIKALAGALKTLWGALKGRRLKNQPMTAPAANAASAQNTLAASAAMPVCSQSQSAGTADNTTHGGSRSKESRT